jgi:hypothetical protein
LPEKRLLRRTFRTKVKEVTGEWKKLQSEELHEVKLPFWWCRDIRSSDMLDNVGWYVTDVSAQHIGPIFKDQDGRGI